MEITIQNPQKLKPRQQSDDEQGKQLFDDLSASQGNPFQNLQLSSQNQQQQQIQENPSNDNQEKIIDFRSMMRLSKKQKKIEKKMRKLKQAKQRNQSKKQNRNLNIKDNYKSDKKPSKKMLLDSEEDEADIRPKQQQQIINLKIQKNSKKVIRNSDDKQKLHSDHDDSDEYSSENGISEDDLGKMDPNSEQQGSGKKEYKKKLGKKSRKQRILQKQGFDLKELGNDVEGNYELNQSVDDSDDSFSDGGRKKKGSKKVKKDKKEKKAKLTNEQFLGKLQQLGCEDEIEQNDSNRYNYDSGLNELEKLRPKKENKNKIKVQNRMFGNLDMQIEDQYKDDQNQVQVPEEKLQLDIKPRFVASSRASSFLNKVENLKKHRGIEADIDLEQFEKINKEKTKRSISQLMQKIHNEVEENEEIDIQIKAPTITKGKSADLINNTMFMVKNLSQRHSTVSLSDNIISTDAKNAATEEKSKVAQRLQQQKLARTQAAQISSIKSRKRVSRLQFFKQIRESISMRKSKYISDDELKNSMKSSKLQQLEEIRKNIEEKRRKQAMYELGEFEDDDAEVYIDALEGDIAKQQGISKAQFRGKVRREEGLEGLEEYEEEGEKKKKKGVEVEPKVVVPVQVQQVQNVDKTNELKQKQLSQVEQIAAKKLMAMQKELRIQKAIMMEDEKIEQESKSRHADDMIDEYEEMEGVEKEQMDLENDQGYDQQADGEEDGQDEDELKDEDQQEAQEGEQAEDEQKQQASVSDKVGDKMEIKHQEDPSLRKELQDEGIIMPGANKKKINSIIHQQDIDFSKYLAENINGQIPQNIVETHSKSLAQKIPAKTHQQTLEFKEFRKLRKIAVVIQQKKKKRQEQLKRAKEFFQQQAELGSDNEENDDKIKAINKKDDEEQEDGDDLDQELEELIDNAVDINEADEDQAFKKYMQQVKQKDRQELQRILRGDFRRQQHDMPEMNEMQEDQRNRIQRMERMVEWMRKRQDDEKDLYAKDDSDADDQMNFYYDYNGNKKRIEKKRNNQDDAQESAQQNNEELEKKLQNYLMDSISPTKRQTDIEINTQLMMELPIMTKKSTMTRVNNFSKKPHQQSPNRINSHEDQLQQGKETPNKITFAGNLLNLAAPKGESNTMPKVKKTSSHMTEYLNKNKSQKPIAFIGSTFKLPGIFNRIGKK